MSLPQLKTYQMVENGTVIGFCQGWDWMIPPPAPGITLVEVPTNDQPPWPSAGTATPPASK